MPSLLLPASNSKRASAVSEWRLFGTRGVSISLAAESLVAEGGLRASMLGWEGEPGEFALQYPIARYPSRPRFDLDCLSVLLETPEGWSWEHGESIRRL